MLVFLIKIANFSALVNVLAGSLELVVRQKIENLSQNM